jgi:hypothetical protein
LLQQIVSHLCRAPIPDVHWAVLKQSAVINNLIFDVHPSVQPDFLTPASPAAAHRLPMPQSPRVVWRPSKMSDVKAEHLSQAPVDSRSR